jgi:cytochrome c
MVKTRALQRRWPVVLIALLLASCDGACSSAGSVPAIGSPSPAVRAVGFDPGPVKTAAQYLLEPDLAAADFARGELLGFACAACHKFRAEEGASIGPNLHGVFGRPAAAIAGLPYSPALRAAGLVWTPVSLDAWLADPAGFVAGTTMPISGYRSADDRRDLGAYLLQATQ